MASTFPLNISTEHDVRERIIWPLLERLGFTTEMVTTQRPLLYKRQYLGRKKPGKDPPIRGEADYVCDVDNRLRLVVEAKAPGEITQADRDQAYTYAAHPEIRAVLFAVISGSNFEVFHTAKPPEGEPLLEFTFEQLEERFQVLHNMVSPSALRRNFPDLVIDVGVPLAPTLKSFAKILRGKQTYTELPESQTARLGSSVHYVGGSVLRDDGEIVLHLVPGHTAPVEQTFAETVGISKIEFRTTESSISTDCRNPTMFHSVTEFVIPEGTGIPIPELFNASRPAPLTVPFLGTAHIAAVLDGTSLRGRIVARPISANPDLQFRVVAALELELE